MSKFYPQARNMQFKCLFKQCKKIKYPFGEKQKMTAYWQVAFYSLLLLFRKKYST